MSNAEQEKTIDLPEFNNVKKEFEEETEPIENLPETEMLKAHQAALLLTHQLTTDSGNLPLMLESFRNQMNKSKSPNENKPKIQPPSQSNNLFENRKCRICNGSASGMNYGVLSCEGCRLFFRRTHAHNLTSKYICQSQNNCDIFSDTGKKCRACRYTNCVAAGMSYNPVAKVELERASVESKLDGLTKSGLTNGLLPNSISLAALSGRNNMFASSSSGQGSSTSSDQNDAISETLKKLLTASSKNSSQPPNTDFTESLLPKKEIQDNNKTVSDEKIIKAAQQIFGLKTGILSQLSQKNNSDFGNLNPSLSHQSIKNGQNSKRYVERCSLCENCPGCVGKTKKKKARLEIDGRILEIELDL